MKAAHYCTAGFFSIVQDYLRENMPAKFKREQKSAAVLPRTAPVPCACDGPDPPGGMKQEGTPVSGTRYHHQVKTPSAGLGKGVKQPTNLRCDRTAVCLG